MGYCSSVTALFKTLKHKVLQSSHSEEIFLVDSVIWRVNFRFLCSGDEWNVKIARETWFPHLMRLKFVVENQEKNRSIREIRCMWVNKVDMKGEWWDMDCTVVALGRSQWLALWRWRFTSSASVSFRRSTWLLFVFILHRFVCSVASLLNTQFCGIYIWFCEVWTSDDVQVHSCYHKCGCLLENSGVVWMWLGSSFQCR